MKTSLRNITVHDQAFVYWYSSGACFTLNLSAKNNKNSKVTLKFQATPPQEKPYTFWAFYNVTAQYNETETIIHLALPKHIAEILAYLLQERPELWSQGKPQMIDSGWEILEGMGYVEAKPVWVAEW
ncbi:hypothetical protein [Paenibacillus wenxiniae]|uniref:Uncharacterized protein n=1 Tax=Paenibacillus wenxiniae TaxID=1636843 RepID=A0ABW4RF39_9BACL